MKINLGPVFLLLVAVALLFCEETGGQKGLSTSTGTASADTAPRVRLQNDEQEGKLSVVKEIAQTSSTVPASPDVSFRKKRFAPYQKEVDACGNDTECLRGILKIIDAQVSQGKLSKKEAARLDKLFYGLLEYTCKKYEEPPDLCLLVLSKGIDLNDPDYN